MSSGVARRPVRLSNSRAVSRAKVWVWTCSGAARSASSRAPTASPARPPPQRAATAAPGAPPRGPACRNPTGEHPFLAWCAPARPTTARMLTRRGRQRLLEQRPSRPLAPLGRCSAGPTEGSLALNVSAVSSWGCLLYSFFCVSTAQLLVAPRPQETAQSEHRPDTDLTARSCERDGAGCCYWFLIGDLVVAAGVEVAGRSVGSARLPRAVHRRGTCLVR